MIQTFSGAHPFRPQCLVAVVADEAKVEELVNYVDTGWCPRCTSPLPEPPEFPAGSRATNCRCVPVCQACGRAENFAEDNPSNWPLEAELASTERRLTELRPVPFAVAMGELVLPEPTSGWRLHGYDDGPDVEEAKGRS